MSQFTCTHPMGIKIVNPDGSTSVVPGPNTLAEAQRVVALETQPISQPVPATAPSAGNSGNVPPGQVKKLTTTPAPTGVLTSSSTAATLEQINPALQSLITAGVITIVG